MSTRRQFLRLGALGGVATTLAGFVPGRRQRGAEGPVVVSTWNHGVAANAAAWEVLGSGGYALDAVEQGVRVTEADPAVTSVGKGGWPDRSGVVTLDACVMTEAGDCGAVAFLQDVLHPVTAARYVMERTPHVMIVGEGARRFAIEQGLETDNLLTPEAERAWREWVASDAADTRAEINVENHDTIGMLALDADGRVCGACTTSGAAWKRHGRVGDSPLIGAGLYVDGEIGGATATGWGEAVVRACGCHLVVELMRQGHDPQEACRRAVERVIAKNPDYRDIQVGFLALDTAGRYGSYCIQPGFQLALHTSSGAQLLDAASRL
ncbi:MAG: N(4)-(beta-N-acetylglucosaminyl)-L-asparaginase [Bacteroidota bacterium]